MTDELEKAFISGDENALSEVSRQYIPLVVSLILNISRGELSREDVEETAADSIISLWYNRSSIEPGRLRGFLCMIAKNKARDRLRRLKNKEHISLEEGEDVESGFLIAEESEQRENARLLREALDRLEEPDREIIMRHYYYYQTSTEIAEIMDMNRTTVKSRIRRAREKLKKLLTEMGVSL